MWPLDQLPSSPHWLQRWAWRARLAQLVRLAGGHCRQDTFWKRLFLLEPPGT